MIVIRNIESLAEMREVEQLQRDIWGVDDLEVYPALAFKPQTEVGAILMGAFAEGRMVGFVFGFPGILNGETIIHSDMLGIREEYRSKNVGYLLKLAQRDAAIERGVKRITWTFDPLQSRNAHFNFAKLGVIADRYYVDYYGVTTSFLHRFGTDRLWVTWLLESERVKSRAPINELPRLVRVGEDLEPIPGDPIDGPQFIIEIPGELKSHHERWREATRKAFTSAIDAGYLVEEFLISDDRKVGRYLLRQD
jgi:predicted GNAT superfamily acetyltransferase